jgi:hypothetical protein
MIVIRDSTLTTYSTPKMRAVLEFAVGVWAWELSAEDHYD